MQIKIESSTSTIFLFSLLEFIFLLIIFIYVKSKKLNFKKYIKTLLYTKLKKPITIIYILSSISIAIIMYFIAPFIIFLLHYSFIFFFGQELYEIAVSNQNEIIILIQTPFDIFLIFIMCFFIIAINEEYFFRGFLLKEIKLSKKWSSLLSAIIFSLYHLVTSFNIFTIILMFLYYFIWGLILNIQLFLCKNQLIFTILTHGLFNFLVYLV